MEHLFAHHSHSDHNHSHHNHNIGFDGNGLNIPIGVNKELHIGGKSHVDSSHYHTYGGHIDLNSDTYGLSVGGSGVHIDGYGDLLTSVYVQGKINFN